jgi:hypothetical protein
MVTPQFTWRGGRRLSARIHPACAEQRFLPCNRGAAKNRCGVEPNGPSPLTALLLGEGEYKSETSGKAGGLIL